MQHPYGARDVEKLLHLPRSTLRALVAAGFVAPARGPRNAWRFSFRDLIVLRTAQALAAANVPRRRIVRALKQLHSCLPDTMPLSGLSIDALGDQVVVREGSRRWHAESGQYLLAFEGDPAVGSLRVIEPAAMSAPSGSDDAYTQASALENQDSDAALRAYERAVAADPSRLDARINLGRLLHERGHHVQAEQIYRDAIAAGARDALLYYNLGVLLDDMERTSEAVQAYEAALRLDPQFADCHYNLALLCEELDQPQQAIRHMSQYRRLTAGRPQ